MRTKLQSRKVSDRPIFWRESRYLFGISKTLRIVGLSLFAGMMLYLYAWSFSMTEPGLIHYAIPYLYTVILLFVAVFASASLVSGERAARTWDVLLTTPLSLRSILWQKLLGTVYRPSAIIALIIAHFLIFAGPWMPSDYFADPFIIAPGLILILLPWTIALCATGILCSTLAKGSRSAASLNFIVALALWFFIPMVAAIVTETVYGYSSSANEWAQAIVFAINPLALLAGLFEAGVNEFPLEYFLDAYVFDGWDFFAYLLVSALIALAIAWISLELARLRIKRTSGRSN